MAGLTLGHPAALSTPRGSGNLKREHWQALDGLRGISIILVVLVHFWAHATTEGNGLPVKLSLGDMTLDLTWIFATGSNGVSIFFVLSGFLLYQHWIESEAGANRSAAVMPFYRRRLKRILPAYVFFVGLYLLLTLLLGQHHFGVDLTAANLVLNFSFLSSLAVWFGSTVASSLDIVPGTWSLNPEMWFYLALPFLAMALRRLPLRWLILLAIACLAPIFRARIGAAAPFTLRYSLPGVMDAFLFGMAVADISARGRTAKAAGLLFPLGAAWYIACCASVSPLRLDWAIQVPASGALMVAGLIAPGNWPWKRWLAGAAIVRLGQISYSMFLCNILVAWYVVLPICELCGLVSPGSRFVMNLFVGFPILYLISLASFIYIEAPFMARERLKPASMMGYAAGIAACVLVMSLVPAALVTITQGEASGEYGGPFVKLAGRVVGLPAKLRPLAIVGSAFISSDAGHESVHLEQTKNAIHFSYDGLDTRNRWIAVMLPVDPAAIVRGRMTSMTARLAVARPSGVQGCLGIYNGARDACSALRAMRENDVLSVETTTAQTGPLQFKYTFFPDGHSGPFDATLSDIAIGQARR